MCPVAIFTLGCKLNQLESEAIAGSFRKAGFPLIPWGTIMEGQGIIIINTCTVTSKADQKARRLIRRALRENPYACVIVTGCYAQLEPDVIAQYGDDGKSNGIFRLFVLGVGGSGAGTAKSSLLDLPAYLLKAGIVPNGGLPGDRLPGDALPRILESWSKLEEGNSPFAFLPEDFVFHSRGYLKIQDGCDNCCAYCRTRLARGPSVSLSVESALAQLRLLESRGCAELMITGVNITQYRHSGFDLAGLLRFLLEGSSTIALRLASLEPEGINEKLVSVLAHPRIRPHFHLSVQSGSDTILRTMGRAYNSQAVERSAALLRSVKDNPFLACDIITGFPGEGEDEFSHTLALCEKIGFAWIHAFPYSERPGTAACSFDNPVCRQDAAQRVKVLTELALRGRRDYAQAWLGRELTAIVEKGGDDSDRHCRAVSENYLKLLINEGKIPPPGSSLRCTPISLCAGADGENPDAIAVPLK
jgi:threonylcarbamoyladenosine tRNA methylthiotransferase MtaB